MTTADLGTYLTTLQELSGLVNAALRAPGVDALSPSAYRALLAAERAVGAEIDYLTRLHSARIDVEYDVAAGRLVAA